MKRDDLLNALASMITAIHRDHPVRIGIDGVDGVGKTTLADELVKLLEELNRRVIRASVDGFHNPASVRYRKGRLSALGYFLDSFNYEALRADLLNPLGPNGSREYCTRVFDHRTDSVVNAPYERAGAGDVLLFDGVFLQREELQGCWDLVIWVEADFELTVSRAIARDLGGSSDVGIDPSRKLARQYSERYVPGQKIYFEACHPRQNADVIVKNEDWSNPELEFGSAGILPECLGASSSAGPHPSMHATGECLQP